MRYFTREWYEGIQKDAMISEVRGDRRAATFSEEFFQSLYAQRRQEWLEEMQEMKEAIFEENWPEEFEASTVVFSSPEGYAREREKYLLERAAAWEEWEAEAFEEEANADFADWYQDELHHIEEDYPREILEGVADVRVLALGVASPEIKKRIARHLKEQEKRELAPFRSYAPHQTELLRKYPGSFVEEFGFHDSVVERVQQRGQELVLDLMSDCEDAEQVHLRFIGCEIERMDKGLEGADWLYEEVYEGASGGWEIHVLFFNCDADADAPLGELILRAADVVIEFE